MSNKKRNDLNQILVSDYLTIKIIWAHTVAPQGEERILFHILWAIQTYKNGNSNSILTTATKIGYKEGGKSAQLNLTFNM